MKVGTKSLLFGYHQFLLHPLFVFAAWVKLYGWPRDPRVVASFFLHDVGYWGKPNMDGKEGKQHPYGGAKIAHVLFDHFCLIWCDQMTWFDFNLLHSRDCARWYGTKPSRLCFADKLAFLIYPAWLLRLLYFLSGEDKEYRQFKYDENGQAVAQGYTVPFDEWLYQARLANIRTLEKEGMEQWK